LGGVGHVSRVVVRGRLSASLREFYVRFLEISALIYFDAET
jgi:hypothetical protein